jgi:type I restriction enzyme M protein
MTFYGRKPEIGERIYDGACGSAGFLCEAYDYLRAKPDLSTKDLKMLQEKTFFGKEKKSLAYVIGIMNMILHGIEAPNIVHTNTLAENISDIQEKDRYHIVLANRRSAARSGRKCSRISRLERAKPRFYFSSISSSR